MSHDIVDKFSSHLKNVLTRALCFVVEMDQKTIQPEHLLWALGTQKGCIGAEILSKAGVKQTALRKLVGATKTVTAEGSLSDGMTLNLSDDAKRIVEKAVLTANIYGHRYVGTEHLLSGILQINASTVDAFFQTQQTDLKELKSQLSIVLKSTSKFPDLANTIAPDSGPLVTQQQQSVNKQEIETATEEKNPALEYFARELTSEEIQKTIDPVIGRDREIERLMEVLARRTKNNPLLLGEPGVGKTAIVEGLAKKIVQDDVPPVLQKKRIFALDMTLVIAGTMYRGEFEGRLQQILEEVKKNDDIILFIDEIHTIVGAGAASGSMDAANILKPALARGEIRCIGATTPAEFKKHVESDSALERRFQSIFVDEPSPEKSMEILHGIAPYYESFHRVRIAPEAIEQAVFMSARYIQDKHLPDKAIDLIDEAAASVRIKNMEEGPVDRRRKIEHDLEALRGSKRQAVVEERFLDAVRLKEEEEVLRTNLQLNDIMDAETVVPVISAKDVASVISKMTNIPVTDLLEEDKERMKTFELHLKKHVMGQDHAIESVAGALRRAKTGIAHPNRPLSSLLFLGPSGVGKTELAKAIAREFFHDEKNLIRLDMSEYSEGFTMSKLIGAPAGYVGYKEQANLTDRIKQRPYCIVLFDELEKSHKDVQNLLLQILEEGEITDATGRKINFRNAIIVMTSNVGLERFERGGLGFSESDESKELELNQDLRNELETRFRPELINRLDHVCIFKPLSTETLEQICQKQLDELVARLLDKGVELSVHENLVSHVCKQAEPKFGARNIRQIIQNTIETKIAERLTKKDQPDRLHIGLTGSKVAVTKPRRK